MVIVIRQPKCYIVEMILQVAYFHKNFQQPRLIPPLHVLKHFKAQSINHKNDHSLADSIEAALEPRSDATGNKNHRSTAPVAP